MKRLITLTFIIFTLTSCSFVSDSEVQNNNVSTNNSLESITNTGTTRRIKNIRKPRTDTGTVTQSNINTNTQVSQNTEVIGNTISDLEKISISTENITSTGTTTETGGIESVSEEQVSQLVDILLEAGK